MLTLAKKKKKYCSIEGMLLCRPHKSTYYPETQSTEIKNISLSYSKKQQIKKQTKKSMIKKKKTQMKTKYKQPISFNIFVVALQSNHRLIEAKLQTNEVLLFQQNKKKQLKKQNNRCVSLEGRNKRQELKAHILSQGRNYPYCKMIWLQIFGD